MRIFLSAVLVIHLTFFGTKGLKNIPELPKRTEGKNAVSLLNSSETIDPCTPSPCGSNTVCNLIEDTAECQCIQGYIGNPYVECQQYSADPCVPSPCGLNTDCNKKENLPECQCIPDYFGDPYVECQPITVDPCIPSPCGLNSVCNRIGDLPECYCIPDYVGDPFVECQPSTNDPCFSSPCGSNAVCNHTGDYSECQCIPNDIRDSIIPCPQECKTNADCPSSLACHSRYCVDTCNGVCGAFTECKVVGHNPTCSCLSGYHGDPFSACMVIPKKLENISEQPKKVEGRRGALLMEKQGDQNETCKTESGDPCRLPFTYKGKDYNGCTMDGHDRLWCYTGSCTTSWGNCQSGCPAANCVIKSPNATCNTLLGRQCQFPFEYKGITYNGCTRHGHDQFWCYSVPGTWDNCDSGCPYETCGINQM